MDTSEEKSADKSVNKSKAEMLRKLVSKTKSQENPVSGLLSHLGITGQGCGAGSGGTVVMITKKIIPVDKAPNSDEPDSSKKVLEKEKAESISPFMLRCMSVITGEKINSKRDEDCDIEKSNRITQALESIKKRKKPKEHEF